MRLVVLGDPIDHSLSPALHTAAFAATGLVGEYGRRRVDSTGLADAITQVRHGDLSGANVTMPHKELAATLCDRLAALAERAGAVNTLVRSAGRVVGHNTDIAGIRAAWTAASLAAEAPVLILGAGGAAAAALLALEGSELFVSARRPEAGDDIAQRISVDVTAVPWGQPVPGAVVVNATPLGMNAEELPRKTLEAAVGLFDMAYGSTETPAVGWARRAGLPVADGPSMLLHQAAVAFELWTGHRAPLEAMRAVLND